MRGEGEVGVAKAACRQAGRQVGAGVRAGRQEGVGQVRVAGQATGVGPADIHPAESAPTHHHHHPPATPLTGAQGHLYHTVIK